jgi:DMSO/TMAO reductase YedYZ molybdopterin-dependent catalytic subunit
MTTAGAAGAAVLATVGQSVTRLRPISVLSPRDTSVGPQHLPINRTAAAAGVVDIAQQSDWQLQVVGPKPFALTLAELSALPQTSAKLPIACVEGWSVDAHWTGVRLRDLAAMAGAPEGADLRVTSLEQYGAYGVSVIEHEYLRGGEALLALRLNGEPLALDHGYPARIIVPNRPGVLQTKWVSRLEVLA